LAKFSIVSKISFIKVILAKILKKERANKKRVKEDFLLPLGRFWAGQISFNDFPF